MNRLKRINIGFVISSILIYSLIYYVAYQVPMHSDDYVYSPMGLSFSSHLSHYLNWSGRFITDYTSAMLFHFFNRPVYMAVNSLALLITIIMISIIPNIVLQKPTIDNDTSVILWVVFMNYWVSNANLGQTSFWIVGSANYLWPIMWASVYMTFILFQLINNKNASIVRGIILFLFAFLAGLSNEATGVCVVIFTITICVLFRKSDKKILGIAFLGTLIGYLLLLLAPGNFSRLDAVNSFWNDFSIFDKILFHVFERMPESLGRAYFSYIICILLFLVGYIFSNDDNNSQKETMSKLYLLFPVLYFVLSICAILVFVVSPVFPVRAENTGLFFLLMVIAFLVKHIMSACRKKAGVVFVVIVCGCYFGLSYSFVAYAYTQTRVQSEIREDIIDGAKAAGEDTVVIPDWYFTRLLKENDKFDTFRSLQMPAFYGLNDIQWNDTTFNYAALKYSTPIPVNQTVKDDLVIENVYLRSNAPFEETVILEFNRNIMNYIGNDESNLFIHLNLANRDEPVDASINVGRVVQLGDKYYYGKTLSYPSLKKLNSIDFGFMNPATGESSVSCTVEVSK